jgi:hypothetical protein
MYHGLQVAVAAGICIALPAPLAVVAEKPTFSVDYTVTISPKHQRVALVRWDLAGIDEINEFRLRFDTQRFDRFRGTGKLEATTSGLRWVPGGPYAHLTYRVRVDHLRGHGQRYDSFAGPDWIITRAREIFPRTLVDWTPRRSARPNSSARLLFRLPAGWRSAAAAAPLDGNSYRLDQPGNVLDRPRGWIALGKLALDREEIADTMVEIARTPNAEVDPKAVFQFLENTLPALKRLLHAESERLLIVVAPDPMWHGGISGENSFFMHAARPLRTPDRTSPYLHELFHVLQPCRMRDDADWIEEGLAEYYSVELQRRAGALDAAAFSRALGYFQRYGVWNVDLTRQYDNAATNNSAPLVMYVLDQRIQRATAGKARLDDVVTRLAKRGGIVDTVRFRHAVEAVTGKKFTKFFDQHVTRGVPPKLNNAK